jgi:hypothetical protein
MNRDKKTSGVLLKAHHLLLGFAIIDCSIGDEEI